MDSGFFSAQKYETDVYSSPVASHNRKHTIVKSDYYRLLGSETKVDRDRRVRSAIKQNGVVPESSTQQSHYKYMNMKEAVARQFARAEVPADRIYMIDKVARMRVLHARFGIDHSEMFNFEIEQANKARDQHQEWLVNKTKIPKE